MTVGPCETSVTFAFTPNVWRIFSSRCAVSFKWILESPPLFRFGAFNNVIGGKIYSPLFWSVGSSAAFGFASGFLCSTRGDKLSCKLEPSSVKLRSFSTASFSSFVSSSFISSSLASFSVFGETTDALPVAGLLFSRSFSKERNVGACSFSSGENLPWMVISWMSLISSACCLRTGRTGSVKRSGCSGSSSAACFRSVSDVMPTAYLRARGREVLFLDAPSSRFCRCSLRSLRCERYSAVSASAFE